MTSPEQSGSQEGPAKRYEVILTENACQQLDQIASHRRQLVIDALSNELDDPSGIFEDIVLDAREYKVRLLSTGHMVAYREITPDDILKHAARVRDTEEGSLDPILVDPETIKYAIRLIAAQGETLFGDSEI